MPTSNDELKEKDKVEEFLVVRISALYDLMLANENDSDIYACLRNRKEVLREELYQYCRTGRRRKNE